jgi:hypothetical protein
MRKSMLASWLGWVMFVTTCAAAYPASQADSVATGSASVSREASGMSSALKSKLALASSIKAASSRVAKPPQPLQKNTNHKSAGQHAFHWSRFPGSRRNRNVVVEGSSRPLMTTRKHPRIQTSSSQHSRTMAPSHHRKSFAGPAHHPAAKSMRKHKEIRRH